jgi:hypothetical protein
MALALWRNVNDERPWKREDEDVDEEGDTLVRSARIFCPRRGHERLYVLGRLTGGTTPLER